MNNDNDYDNHVTKKDLYEKLWAARDFEISHLWQRSVFLATFITISFTLYFTAFKEFTTTESDFCIYLYKHFFEEDSSFFHYICLELICLVGFTLAILWICMARGSKYMYERIENGINRANENADKFFDTETRDHIADEWYEVLWNQGYYTYLPRHGAQPMSDVDFRFFSTNGAKFSSSKINIMIGYILFISWLILSVVSNVLIYKTIGVYEIVFIVLYLLTFLSLFFNFGNISGILTLSLIILSSLYCFIPLVGFNIIECNFPWFYIVFALQLLVLLIVSKCCLSGYYLRFTDYLRLLFYSPKPNYKSDKRQFAYISDELKKDNGYFKRASDILKKHGSKIDNILQQDLISDFIEHKTPGAVKRLYNDEELKNIFETALMKRDCIKGDKFKGTWKGALFSLQIDDNDGHITTNLPYVSKFVLTDQKQTMIFADTEWKKIRNDDNSYQLGFSDLSYHIVSKAKGGSVLYMTLSLPKYPDPEEDQDVLNISIICKDSDSTRYVYNEKLYK